MNLPDNVTKIKDLGEGSFGKVILCENNFLNRQEALKIVDLDFTDIEKTKSTFFEPMILEYLRNSDYIVKVYDANLQGSDKFIIRMEYLEKGSLESKKIVNIKDFLKIAEHISYALEYAHNKSILHLDVKPGNILIASDTHYKLSDFGLSNIKDNEGKSKFKMIYNFHTPPENIDKPNATEQSDIYMFGITLYRLINGKIHYLKQLKKYGSDKNYILKGRFPERDNYLPHIPKKIRTFINKAINVDLSKRFKSVKDFRKALTKLKIKLFWDPIIKDGDIYRLNCFTIQGKLLYHIEFKQNINGLFSLIFFKHGLKNIQKVSGYCYKNISNYELIKKINEICSEFI